MSQAPTSPVPGAPAKVCVVCKQDVSKKPRVKDPQGRYLCEPCFKAAEARKNVAAPKAVAAPRAPEPAREMAGAGGGGGGGADVIFDAMDGGDAGLGDVMLPEGYDPAMAIAAVNAKPEAPVLPRQAEAEGKGKKKKKSKAAAKFQCRHCGYDMSGSMSLRCPECGKMNMEPKNQGLLDDEREIKRAMYRRPLILMAVGWGISLAALALGHAGWEKYAVLFAVWVITIPLGVLTFWICSLMFLEYDAPFHVTALRLAGIYACVGIANAVAMAVGFNAFGYAAVGLLILLYMTELELDKWEAVGLAIAGFVVQVAAVIGLIVLAGILVAGTGGLGGGGSGTGAAPAGSSLGLVSPSDPSGTVYYDNNMDGVDDGTGNPVPNDAVPVEEPTEGAGGGGED